MKSDPVCFENLIVGAALIEGSLDGVDFLLPEDFTGPYRIIWSAMRNLHNRNEPIDLVTVVNELRNTGQLIECGGAAFIAGITDDLPLSIDGENDL